MTEALDMSRFIEARSDQLNADDLIGRSMTITVTKVTGADGDQPVSIYYEGDNGKPFKPCKTIRRVLVAIWGRFANDYVGRSMTLYRDDAVMFGGLQVGGIRISHMSHLDKKTVVVVAKSKGKKAGMEIEPLVAEVREMKPSPAQKWANAYTARVAEIGDPETLAAFANEKAKKLHELESAAPALHTECVAALDKRRAELAGFSADDGETDDGFSDDEAPHARTVAKISAMIDKAIGVASWEAAKDEYTKHMMALPKDVCAPIEAALQAKKGELGL